MEDKKILKDELLEQVTAGAVPGLETIGPVTWEPEKDEWNPGDLLPTEAGNYKLPIDIEHVPLYPEYEKKD